MMLSLMLLNLKEDNTTGSLYLYLYCLLCVLSMIIMSIKYVQACIYI